MCAYTSIVLKDSHQECLQCEKNKQMSAEASNKIGKFVDCRQHFTYMYKKTYKRSGSNVHACVYVLKVFYSIPGILMHLMRLTSHKM